MSKDIKTFSSILTNSTITEVKNFPGFSDLNKQIEEGEFSKDCVIAACNDIISMGKLKKIEGFEYTLLHNQIERLIQLNNISIDKILNFVDEKFKSFEDAMIDFLISSISIGKNNIPLYGFFKIRSNEDIRLFIEKITNFDGELYLKTFFPNDMKEFLEKISNSELKPDIKSNFSEEPSVSIEIDLPSSKQDIYNLFIKYSQQLRQAYLERMDQVSKEKQGLKSFYVHVFSIDPVFTKKD